MPEVAPDFLGVQVAPPITVSKPQADPAPVSVAIDPTPALTEALKGVNKLIDWGHEVYSITPEALRIQGAADWAQFIHNCSAFVITLQEKINALVVK